MVTMTVDAILIVSILIESVPIKPFFVVSFPCFLIETFPVKPSLIQPIFIITFPIISRGV